MDIDLAILKHMGVVMVKAFDRLNQVGIDLLSLKALALDPRQVENAVCITRKAVYVMEHVANILDLLVPGELVT